MSRARRLFRASVFGLAICLASASVTAAGDQREVKSKREWTSKDGRFRAGVEETIVSSDTRFDARFDIRSPELGHFELTFRWSPEIGGDDSRLVDLGTGWFARYSIALGARNGLALPPQSDTTAVVGLLSDERTTVYHELEMAEGVIWHFEADANHPELRAKEPIAESMSKQWQESGVVPTLPTNVLEIVAMMDAASRDSRQALPSYLKHLSLVLEGCEVALSRAQRDGGHETEP